MEPFDFPSKKLTKIKAIRFAGSDANLSEKVSESFDTSEEYIENEVDKLPSCIHGHAIRSLQELGGRCICDAVLCKDCAQIRCEIDKRILCGLHAEDLNGQVVCSTHGLFQKLVIAFCLPA